MDVLGVVAGHVRASAGCGRPLESGVAGFLRGRFGADLSAVRVHTDPAADRCARLLGADAFAAGADIYFADGRYRPGSREGLRLLAHEVAHVVQQASRATPTPGRQGRGEGAAGDRARWPGLGLEMDADLAADAVVEGGTIPESGVVARRVCVDEAVVVQCHSSWEHRILGEVPPAILDKLAKYDHKDQTWRSICAALCDFYAMWEKTGNIDASTIATAWSQMDAGQDWGQLTTIKLNKSGLVVTYGELNALADYMANPEVIEDQDYAMLEPIFQTMRSESYDRFAKLIARVKKKFTHEIKWNSGTLIDKWRDAEDMDNHTKSLGTNRTNALLARNACHFAPYSWYRWKLFHNTARAYARDSYEASGGDKEKYKYLAIVNNGYADHFLQDSFASGHLINKTLVMQWWVDWVKNIWYNYVAHWYDAVQYMDNGQQPGLAARQLYDPENPGSVFDPQTAEEQSSKQARMNMCGVQPATGDAYTKYLWFMSCTAAQLASGAMHDYYCEQGLWVTSKDRTTPYLIYGDEHMLDGGDGARIAAETAQMSRHAIEEILGTGATSITITSIYDRFPSTAASSSREPQLDLATWHDRKARDKALNDVFNNKLSRLKTFIGGFKTIPQVSQDMPKITAADMTAADTSGTEPAGHSSPQST